MFWYKLYNARYDIVLAACDKELLGKTLKEGKIKIIVNENFYKGDLIDEIGIKKLLNLSTIGNLIGENIITIAEKEGFISRENVLIIDGVPHAQFVKIQ